MAAAAAFCGVSINRSPADGCGPFRFGVASPLHRELLIVTPPLRSRRRIVGARCSLASSERESRGGDRTVDEDLGPVFKFEMSDLAVSNHVSLGLQGRADEVIFESTVRNSKSPLYNSRVVLRKLTSVQARRRGRRALEVLKKLARRQLMYHSCDASSRLCISYKQWGEQIIYFGARVPWELFLEALASALRLASNFRSNLGIG